MDPFSTRTIPYDERLNLNQGHFDKRPWAFFGAIFALMLAAANLRGGLVIIGPLVADMRADLGVSASAFGMLMTLPLICFGLISLLVPSLARRIEPLQVVLLAIIVIAIGAALRLVINFPVMLFGTLLLGTGVAILNVLIPGLVKGLFPRQSGSLTGLYTLILTLGATLSILSAVPMRDYFGSWQAPMVVWALLPLLAALVWLPMLRVKFTPKNMPTPSTSAWRLPRAWALMAFMGLQSSVFYVLATWLPRLLMDSGYSDIYAGNLTSLLALVGLPAAFIIPIAAGRLETQRPLVLMILITGLAGLFGLLLMPERFAEVWVSLLGIYGGSSLSLALVLFALKTHDMRQATSLSAMVQGLGYLGASLTPSIVGAIYDFSHEWTLVIWSLIVIIILQNTAGWVVCGRGKIDEKHSV